MAQRETGTVKWFNDKKGFGFISRDQGDDLFVHYSAIEGAGFRTLRENDKVEFEVVSTDKGEAAAKVQIAS
jgi:CspA family cold shock protein